MDDPVSNVICDNMGSDYKNQETVFLCTLEMVCNDSSQWVMPECL